MSNYKTWCTFFFKFRGFLTRNFLRLLNALLVIFIFSNTITVILIVSVIFIVWLSVIVITLRFPRTVHHSIQHRPRGTGPSAFSTAATDGLDRVLRVRRRHVERTQTGTKPRLPLWPVLLEQGNGLIVLWKNNIDTREKQPRSPLVGTYTWFVSRGHLS